MNNYIRFSCATAFIFATAAMPCPSSHAALYGGWGTLAWDYRQLDGSWRSSGLAWNGKGPDFSLCFAGDSVDAISDRVLETLDHLRHFEWAANIKFHPPGNKTIRIQSGNPLVATDWRCPDTGSDENPEEGDLGDIRILLWTPSNDPWWITTPVGGHYCRIFNPWDPVKKGGPDWGAIGSGPHLSKWCNFNVKLSEIHSVGIFYLNHTLHEVGHKLGLGHEFDRSDESLDCHFDDENKDPVVGTIENGKRTIADGVEPKNECAMMSEPMIFMTLFDRDSVMHYQFPDCKDIIGNVGSTGFSALDKLALRILYPEDNMFAEFSGVRVIKSWQQLSLKNSWKRSGAIIDGDYPVAKNFSWKIDGIQISTLPDLDTSNIDISLTEGKHLLEYSYQDFLGRSYYAQNQVEVLSPTAFDQRMASQAAIISANATASTAAISSLVPIFNVLLQ